MDTHQNDMLIVGTPFSTDPQDQTPTAEEYAEAQRKLTEHNEQARRHATEALTLTLEEFLEDTGYDGHQPTSHTLVVNGAEESIRLVQLHQPTPGIGLVFVNSSSYGRTYGIIGKDGKFEPMSLLAIRVEFGDVAIRHMAASLILGKHLDEMTTTREPVEADTQA